jgi:hypothetical protein
MSISRVQKTPGGSAANTVSSVSDTWGSPTTAGNFLATAVATNGNPGTITPPTGLTQLGTTQNNGSCYIAYFTEVNCGVRSGAQSFSFQNAVSAAVCRLFEYSGIKVSSPQDGSTGVNNGSSTSPATGQVSSTNASDLFWGAVAQAGSSIGGNDSFSGPTNGFTLVNSTIATDGSHNQVLLGTLEQIVSATQSNLSAGVTAAKNESWAGILAAWQGAPANPVRKQLVFAPQPPSSSFD